MSNTLDDIIIGAGLLLLVTFGNYISMSEIEKLQRKVNHLNLRVKSLETSIFYHEIRISELEVINKSTENTLESEENEQGC